MFIRFLVYRLRYLCLHGNEIYGPFGQHLTTERVYLCERFTGQKPSEESEVRKVSLQWQRMIREKSGFETQVTVVNISWRTSLLAWKGGKPQNELMSDEGLH